MISEQGATTYKPDFDTENGNAGSENCQESRSKKVIALRNQLDARLNINSCF